MKSFLEFVKINGYIISEELHTNLQTILDTDEDPEKREKRIQQNPYNTIATDPHALKLNRFVKEAKRLLKNGEETGLESDKPKKGSSRAVFFPKEGKKVSIDGKPTQIPTAVKIGFPGLFDRFKKTDEDLLGHMQNRVEGDNFIKNTYGMLSENHHGEFTTNPNGVLAPVLSSHPDSHYLEMGKISPMKKTDFQKLTVTESHPKGIKFDDMYNTLNKEYHDAHGQRYSVPSYHTDEFHEHIMDHPFVRNLHEMMLNTDMHPGDIRPANMGIWRHPHTGKQHPVISDYGYSTEIANEYNNRRKRMFNR